MRSLALAAAILLTACATATAQPSAPAPAAAAASPVLAAIPYSADASRNAAEAPAGAYTLDSRHVNVTWRIRHLGLSLFTARFDTVSGTLNWDGANPAASSVNLTIAANSVNTGVLNAQGERAFDREIHTQVFGSEANPNITFVSRSIQVTSPTTGLITGDLTLRGVTRPVVLEATFEGGRYIAFRQKHGLGFSGRTIIRRSEFGAALSNPIANGTTGDEVEILFQGEFLKN